MVRTVITCFIIGIGIMALVCILTSVDGLKMYLYNSFSAMGANTFKIRNRSLAFNLDGDNTAPKIYRSITFLEASKFKDEFNSQYPVSIQYLGNMAGTVKYENKKTNPNMLIMGTDENYLQNESYTLVQGRNFTNSELHLGSNVALLGYTVAKKIFGTSYHIQGKVIRIDDIKFSVIGVLNEKGSSLITTDNIVLIPMAKARQYYPNEDASYILSVKTNSSDSFVLNKAIESATVVMRNVRKLHPGEDNNFDMMKSDSISGMLVEKTQYATVAGFIIGIITLFGAAIGLMNIMLVSVTERTREIGTLKAIGATSNNILAQFLIEAIVICQLGGILGIILGIIFGNIVSIYIGGSFMIPWVWILTGLIFCLVVGLISGIYPAFKAASQDPIEALRYE